MKKPKLLPFAILLGGLLYAGSEFANAKEFKITLGIGTPLTQNQDIHKANGATWKQGDIVGTAIISTECFSTLDCSLWHHSIITDTQDYGVTGISVTKTWKFNW